MSKKYKGYRAGIIPYFVDEDSTILYMFMKPSDPEYGGSDWQIAKGRFDDGEDDALVVAVREGREELGLVEGNIVEDHIDYVGEFRKMFVYTCRVLDMDHFDQFHYETGDVCWLSNDEYQAFGRDIHKDIVQATHDLVTQSLSDHS